MSLACDQQAKYEMEIEDLNNAQEMLADNDAAILTDLLSWLEDSDALLEALQSRLPTLRPTDASMIVNRIRASLVYTRQTEVPLLLNVYQPPADSGSTTPPQPIIPTSEA
jgi:hypothetical protein